MRHSQSVQDGVERQCGRTEARPDQASFGQGGLQEDGAAARTK
ncbi:hypothetical protein [Streptomyces sp. NPDC006289]